MIKPLYKHTSYGYSFFVICFVCSIFLICLAVLFTGFFWPVVVAQSILCVCLALFSTLTIIIEDGFLKIHFGPIKAFRKAIPLDHVQACQRVNIPRCVGWWLRLMTHGWLYWIFNDSGLDAVELKMMSGKIYRIWTDEPEALEAALQQSLNRKPQS